MEQKYQSRLLVPMVKRMILKWVNDDRDPEESVKHKAVLGVPAERQEWVFYYMRLRKEHLQRAFEATDAYERDWRLVAARYYNAKLHVGQLLDVPGVFPMAKDSTEDRVLAFAQARLANRMAVCERAECKRYYFRKSDPQAAKEQKYCSGECRLEAKRALNRNWYHESQNSGESVRFDD